MKHKFFVLFFSLFLYLSVNSIAQSNFIPGSVTLKSGEVLEGKIDYQAWSINPELILFKPNSSTAAMKYNPNEIAEFEVENAKYISAEVSIDQTPFKIYTLNLVSPTSITETVFLKVIVEGEISLYQYRHIRNNFYIRYQNQITELISNQYVVSKGSSYFLATENEYLYRNQISELVLNCPESNLENLNYSLAEFREFVINCNQVNSFEVNYVSEKSRVRLRHQLFTGVIFSSFSEDYYEYRYIRQNRSSAISFDKNKVNFDRTFSFTIGYGLQFELPENLRKRSIGFYGSYSKFEYKSGDNFLNVIYSIPNAPEISERQIISDPTMQLQVLDFRAWYAQRINTGFPTFFVDGGIGFKYIFNPKTSAFYQVTQYLTSDINTAGFSASDPINSFEGVQEFDISKPEFLIGTFLGAGYETKRLFTSIKIEYFWGTFPDNKRTFKNIQYQQPALSLVTGIKF